LIDIQIVEVKTKRELKAFITFPDDLYKGNAFYVPPLHNGEYKTLSKQNPAFEYCEAKYWLAKRKGKTVGRIAGIVNARYNQKNNGRFARFGWLDFIEEEKVLSLLMETFECWAKNSGAEKAHGPLGFISFDPSGVLVDGFEEVPTSFGHYNYPYYDGMLKAAGYEKDVDWVEYEIKFSRQTPERFSRAAALIAKRYGVRNISLKSTKKVTKYAEKLFELLNVCYTDLYGFNELSPKQIKSLKKSFLYYINPDYISIVLNDKDELMGFGIAIPSLSKALQKSKGSLFPFGYFRIWKALKKNDTADLLLLGVKPEFQNKGIHSLVFNKLGQTFLDQNIKYLETTRELEHNHNVTQLWSRLEHRQHKRVRCYRKKFK
jgi:hypothetical protein